MVVLLQGGEEATGEVKQAAFWTLQECCKEVRRIVLGASSQLCGAVPLSRTLTHTNTRTQTLTHTDTDAYTHTLSLTHSRSHTHTLVPAG